VHPTGELVGHARNGVTHRPTIMGYDSTMAILGKIFLIFELLLILGLVTKMTFGA
jgi:hypothetical protein